MASTDLPATLVQQIAGNVLSVAAAAIPLEVVEHTKTLIVDSIGCALAAIEVARSCTTRRKPGLHRDRFIAAR
jgi:2-methylcitrate dehydratase PrpD